MALRFHPPQGDLKFWSALWLLYGVGGSIYALVTGVPALLLMTIPVGLLTLGIWLRIKVCGQILFWVLVVSCLLAIPMVFKGGEFNWRRLIRICLSGYFAYLVWAWVQAFESQQTLADDSDTSEPR
jgi:hypothetical protein